MRTRAIIIIFAILVAAAVTGTAGKSDDGGSGKDSVQPTVEQTSPSETGTPGGGREQEHLQTPEQTLQGSQSGGTETEQHKSQESGLSGAQSRELEQEHLQAEIETHRGNLTGTSAEQLREHLQEQEQELEMEHSKLTSDERLVQERHRNESALVQVLQNGTLTAALLGAGPGGIGPQLSSFAEDWNASLRAQIQAERQIQGRNAIVRLFLGGDTQAASLLAQEVTRNQDRIRQMQQLIQQCQACDPQVQSVLQEQLRQMEGEQVRIQEEAQKEIRDTGLFGWIGR